MYDPSPIYGRSTRPWLVEFEWGYTLIYQTPARHIKRMEFIYDEHIGSTGSMIFFLPCKKPSLMGKNGVNKPYTLIGVRVSDDVTIQLLFLKLFTTRSNSTF